MTSGIDAVFTWVDGNDPDFCATKASYAAHWWTDTPAGWKTRSSYTGEAELRDRAVIASHARSRFRDREELRFALRSVAQYAPWIRRIFIVTNGQVPAWLDPADDRITIVPHDRLFEDRACLPTFNSNAIESTIHRIPGLSDDFLYFNDDFFFGRPVTIEDFLNGSTHRLFVESARKMPRDMTDRSMIAHSWAFNHALLDDRVGRSTRRKMFAHTPQIYNKHVLAEIQLVWREHFERTRRNRFRTAFDAAFRLLYTYYVGERLRPLLSQGDTTQFGELVEIDETDYVFIKVGDPLTDYRADMARAQHLRPAFFCVNDELPDDASALEEEAMASLTRQFLLRFFPDAQSWERLPLAGLADDDAAPLGVSGQGDITRVRIGPGDPVPLNDGDALACLGAGWHGLEHAGLWSDRPAATLQLSIDPPPASASMLRITGRVFGAALPGGRLVRFVARIGDRTVASEVKADDDDYRLFDVPLPSTGSDWDGQVALDIRRLIAPTPAQMGVPMDTRHLGFCIYQIAIEPVETDAQETAHLLQASANS